MPLNVLAGIGASSTLLYQLAGLTGFSLAITGSFTSSVATSWRSRPGCSLGPPLRSRGLPSRCASWPALSGVLPCGLVSQPPGGPRSPGGWFARAVNHGPFGMEIFIPIERGARSQPTRYQPHTRRGEATSHGSGDPGGRPRVRCPKRVAGWRPGGRDHRIAEPTATGPQRWDGVDLGGYRARRGGDDHCAVVISLESGGQPGEPASRDDGDLRRGRYPGIPASVKGRTDAG
jgi:hypothetical protein